MEKKECIHILCHYTYYKNGRVLTCSHCGAELRFDEGTVKKVKKEIVFTPKDE